MELVFFIYFGGLVTPLVAHLLNRLLEQAAKYICRLPQGLRDILVYSNTERLLGI
jgi:hypothetical protein